MGTAKLCSSSEARFADPEPENAEGGYRIFRCESLDLGWLKALWIQESAHDGLSGRKSG